MHNLGGVEQEDLQKIREYIWSTCGIWFDESKDYLVENRLGGLCKSEDVKSYAELIVRAKQSTRVEEELVDCVTINETLFFRDDSPYKALQHKVFPELIDAREETFHSKRLRIWSAACSTGQEAYSIAITLTELIPDIAAWDIEILGSDISKAALAQAEKGAYKSFEIERGLPPEFMERYFIKGDGEWTVKDNIRRLCRFEQRNLTRPLLGAGPFDVVFCRNVAIYFTPEARKQLFDRIADTMADDGYLFVGSSECLQNLGFNPQHHCHSVFYRPALDSQPRADDAEREQGNQCDSEYIQEKTRFHHLVE